MAVSSLNIAFFIQRINHFRTAPVVIILHPQPELALLCPQHHRLPVQPPYHVQGRLRLAPQGHLQRVLRHTLGDGLLQLRGYFEVPVRRAHAADPLMGTLVVIMPHPQPDAFPGLLIALERRP